MLHNPRTGDTLSGIKCLHEEHSGENEEINPRIDNEQK